MDLVEIKKTYELCLAAMDLSVEMRLAMVGMLVDSVAAETDTSIDAIYAKMNDLGNEVLREMGPFSALIN